VDTFSNKYINFFDILKKSVIGFEFEFYAKRSFYRLLELLNRELSPIKVHGKRKYHSEFEPDEYNFKIEPDYSGGPMMCELITGPMPYVNAKIILLKILKILQDNAKTDDRCSIHINISFDKDLTEDKDVTDVNKLKMILEIDEELIFKYFPNRKDNFYAKSIKKLVPFKGYNYSTDAVNLTLNNFQLTDDTKYYGVNLKESFNGRLEFRYIGGEDYQSKTREIIELMDYFISLSWNCITEDLSDENINNLRKYLDENINIFKNFARLENFVAEFPTIQLEIDQNDSFLIVKSQYSQLQDKLYDIMRNIYDLNNCIINYDSSNSKLEIVDASFETIFTLKGIGIIDSNVVGGEYLRCELSNVDVKNAHLSNCTLVNTDVFNCKLENCDTDENCTLRESYFAGGVMNSIFQSGTMRGGIVGERGELLDGVDIISDDSSYFGGTGEDEDVVKGPDKKKITMKGKI
jgi:hypothetical protein